MDSVSVADIHLEYAPDLFVDRSDAIKQVRLVVADLTAGRPVDTRAVAFVSESGTGKSWLLRHLAEKAITPDDRSLAVGHQLGDEGMHSLYVNLNAWDVKPENDETLSRRVRTLLVRISHQVAAWMDVVPTGTLGTGEQAPLEDLGRWLEADVRQYVEKSVLVLMLDQVYESPWSLLDLLDRYLLGPLAAIPRVLIVLAGRGRGYPWKSPELRLHTERIELKRFDPEQTREQLSKQVPARTADAEMIWQVSSGYPRSNYAIARLGADIGLETIVQQLLDPVPSERRDQVQKCLEVLCVVRSFDEDRIPRLLAAYYDDPSYEQWSYQQAVAVRKELVKYAFAAWDDTRGGWVLDDAVRSAIESHMRSVPGKSELLSKLQGKAYEMYQEWRRQYPIAGELWSVEADYPLAMAYSSVRATPELVGRVAELNKITQAVRDAEHSYIIQIIGRGGIGKTRLTDEVLRCHRNDPALLVARRAVDLYHVTTHSIEGLMTAIQQVVTSDSRSFEGFERARKELDNYLAEPSGDKERLKQLRDKVERAFLGDLSGLSRFSRLILAFDTAEGLVYEVTDVERKLGLSQERIGVWSWLRDVLLPTIPNSVIIIAGRESSRQLADAIRLRDDQFRLEITLGPFSVDEATDYFAAVAGAAAYNGYSAVAHRILALPLELQRTMIHKTGGHPILLALALDYLVIADRLSLNLDQLDGAGLEQELIYTIQGTGRPADKALRALAWLRKGADPELLARVAELQTMSGQLDLDQAEQILKQLKRLSFVKVRPSDGRVFLHDELYRLLERYVLHPDRNTAQTERTYDTILDGYRLSVKQARDELAISYQAIGQTDENPVQRVAEATERLHAALVENLHYQLRADADRGIEMYYRYAEEAALGETSGLDIQLRAELLDFLYEHTSEETGARLRSWVEADGAIRWVKRYIADQRYDDAQGLAKQVRASGLLSTDDRLAEVELSVWEALAQNYGNLRQPVLIEQTLQNAVRVLRQIPRTWRREAVLARAYNNLGYLHINAGRYGSAIEAYRKAIPLWRAVNIPLEQANTLNNLAFARSEMGDFGTAHRQANDALGLRQESGARPPIGLSHTTLAHIAIHDSLFITAERHAERALQLASAANDLRGQGLALIALAEAKRRYGVEGFCQQEESRRLLREAIKRALQACDLSPVIREPSRQVEALIELGCAYRDRMKLWRHCPSSHRDELVEGLAEKGKGALQAAQRVAHNHDIAYLQVDALVNEAWLHYYMEVYYRRDRDLLEPAKSSRHEAEVCLQAVLDLIPPSYRIAKLHGVPPLDLTRATVPFLTQMGKASLLWGQMSFNDFEFPWNGQMDCMAKLRQAIEHYTLSLAYDNMISQAQFRDKRRAKDRMYQRLKTLNLSEWRMVYQAVTEVEVEYRLGQSEMRRFLEDNFGSPEELQPIDV